jgi:hypothetical protein
MEGRTFVSMGRRCACVMITRPGAASGGVWRRVAAADGDSQNRSELWDISSPMPNIVASRLSPESPEGLTQLTKLHTALVCFEKKTSQPCATNLCQPVPTPLDTQCAITAPVTHAVTACDASVQCGL